jgi:ubiquinone biosynthesis protein
MPPFPVEEALEAVERTAGRPWDEIFSVFDPEPIGSASMACVYQATLMDGTKVAVKVRRPEIGELFMADFWVLDRLAELAEFLTFFRPGFSRNLRAELRDTLLEELDFRREGRFQDIFRRHAPKSGKTFFTAPKVYFEWSGEEVLVQEFVSGYWLWEIVGVVENGSPGERAMLQRLNIDPKEVARRLLWAVFWSMEEDMFFHADPHPANILVRPNSELTFIDFGSCGSFNYEQKAALEQIVVAMQNKDVEGMVRAATELLEPLPPMDVPEFLKMAETEFMHVLNTFNTPAEYTEWWERTTARQWISLVRVARKFNLPLSLHMLRMIRATLLYDTIVLRLDRRVDRYSEYALFMKERVKFVRKRWRKRLRDSGSDGFYLRLDELADGASDLMLRAQKVMTTPIVTFGPTVDKWIFSVTVLSRMVGRILIVTLLTMGIVEVVRYGANEPSSPLDVLQSIFDSRYYQIFIVGAVVLNIRQILFRLRERDVGNN